MSGTGPDDRSDDPTPPHGTPTAGGVPPWDPSAGSSGSSGTPQDQPWSSPSGADPSGPTRTGPATGGYQVPPGGGYQNGPPGGGYQSGPPGGGVAGGPPPAGTPAYGGPPPFGRPAAPKPGIVPLRPLGLGEILDGAVSYIRAHPTVVLGASAIVAVIGQLVQVPLQYLLTGGAARSLDPASVDVAQLGTVVAGSAAGGLVGGAISLVTTAILTGLLMVVISRAVLGAPVDAAECWRAARPRVPGLLGVTVLVALLAVVIMLVCILPGALVLALGSALAGGLLLALGVIVAIVAVIVVSVGLSLSTPAYVLEGIGVTTALKRSWALVRPRFWPVLGVSVLAFLIAFVISGIIGVPFGFLAAAVSGGGVTPGLGAQLIIAVGTIIASTLVAPFQSGVIGLLYIDQRMRREAFDLELQRATGGGPPR